MRAWWSDRASALLALAGALALLAAWGLLLDQGGSGFLLAYVGMEYPNITEIVFGYYFLLTAAPALLLLVFALVKMKVGERLMAYWDRFAAWPMSLALLAGFVLLATLSLRAGVLQGAATTQDEYVYDFIADTLEAGRLVNEVPDDPEHFANEFMILNDRGWFGKYPIGHPLLLAAAGRVGLRNAAVPVVSAALLVVTFVLGARLYDRRTALLAAVLLAVSPQFLLTGATRLSQPASALFASLGLVGLVAWERRPRALTALGAGLAFGFALLVRPFPGLLFVPVAAAALLAGQHGGGPRRKWLHAALVGAGVLGGLAALAAVNLVQTGDAFRTGYHIDYKVADTAALVSKGHSAATVTSSVMNGLARLHVWQAGFPLLLVCAFFARPVRGRRLLWGMLGALLAYRFLIPKAGVVSTGPIYLYEALPWLAVLCADGLRRSEMPSALGWFTARSRRIAFLAGGAAVALAFFWPVNLESLYFGARRHQRAYDMVERAASKSAVVFYEARIQGTWARYLRNPKPDLSDDVLYLRKRAFSYAELEEFAARRFPDRERWVLLYSNGGNPRLLPLSDLVEKERQEPRPPERLRIPVSGG